MGAYLWTRPKSIINNIVNPVASNNTSKDTMSSVDIATKYTPAVVRIEVAWSLIDVTSGHVLSQVYVANSQKDKSGKAVPLIQGADEFALVLRAQGPSRTDTFHGRRRRQLCARRR